jgi:hypothetical protein
MIQPRFRRVLHGRQLATAREALTLVQRLIRDAESQPANPILEDVELVQTLRVIAHKIADRIVQFKPRWR